VPGWDWALIFGGMGAAAIGFGGLWKGPQRLMPESIGVMVLGLGSLVTGFSIAGIKNESFAKDPLSNLPRMLLGTTMI
jgi:hypothetical protein